MTATDSVSKVLTSAQAMDGRDAFVKVILIPTVHTDITAAQPCLSVWKELLALVP